MISSSRTPSHGSKAFSTHGGCRCRRCEKKREAVTRLVDSFSGIPAEWIADLAEHDGTFLPLPMWSTLFLPKDAADVRAIKRLLRPLAVEDKGSDLAALAEAGWQAVADTGILAIEFREELLLGIHGAGYSFYAEHWEPLYNAMGYHWHE